MINAFEKLFKTSIAPYYAKTSAGKYVEVNDAFLLDNDTTSDSWIIGQKDIDLWDGKAPLFTANDQEVLHQRKAGLYMEDVVLDNKKRFYISYKTPLMSQTGKIIGLQGISILLNNLHQMNLPDELYENLQSFQIKTRPFSANSASIIKLTDRQKDCLYYLTRGMTAKKIGSILKLSPKTVESHIELLKKKLGCYTRHQLIEKGIELGDL